MHRKNGFTLADVLITLGIIGVVASLTLSTLITNIQNKGYAEKLKKTYSLLQQTTNLVAEEFGAQPSQWSFYFHTYGEDESLNQNIFNAYAKNLKILKIYGYETRNHNYYQDNIVNKITYRYLNGESNAKSPHSSHGIFTLSYIIELSDSTTIGFNFAGNAGGGNMWLFGNQKISLAFIVDVNGCAKPNQIGRDIFWLYIDPANGKLLPYNINDTSDCTKDGKGYSCAAKIINEGKMNY